MKRTLLAFAAAALLSLPAEAATKIGVSMAHFDDNFLTILRNAMTEEAKAKGAEIQFEDAKGDIGNQTSQIQNFIASGVDAIIVNPVDTSATPQMSQLTVEAKIPLVFVNRKPDGDTLPDGVVFVGSDERQSGTLEMEELARLAGHKGNVVVMVGELATNAAQLRTKDVEDVVAKYPDMKIVEKQTANFQRNEAIDLMTNWLTAGTDFTIVAANNDEMAIGAILAMRQAGKDPKPYLIGGVDATPDALAEMEQGTLDVTVFQNARGQGRGAVEAALKLAAGEKLDSWQWIPFELVTPDNMKKFSQ
ncbi:sugar ABC transporter substrate-binding protein [Inquilinus sp. OTU3971]|uniref:sugar ABC transporter substrate-binding protein n=1 Tax=Inquilinus sp. OTU3971 TaxID=3043855 RepID=UPI00313B2B0C